MNDKKGKHSLSLGKPSIALQIVFQHLKAICFNYDESIQSKLCSRKNRNIWRERGEKYVPTLLSVCYSFMHESFGCGGPLFRLLMTS